VNRVGVAGPLYEAEQALQAAAGFLNSTATDVRAHRQAIHHLDFLIQGTSC
jgi:hypothetical protein